jgi:predicted phage terminase large subunit-like protein
MGLREFLEERQRRKCEGSLYEFFLAAWKVLEPETPLVESWHYRLLCEYLELIEAGEFREKFPDKIGLLINVPPRTAKSLLISVIFPCWCWLRRPALRFLCASYGQTLAEDHSAKRRALILSTWFQKNWGDRFSLMADRNRLDDFGNDKTGYMIATSVGGATTGFGGDVCIGDDLLNQAEAYSEAARKGAASWIDSTWRTKLNNPATGVYIYVSQRLALDDPSGHLLEQQGERFIHIKIPMEEMEGREYGFPKSEQVHWRPKGDVLQRDRFNRGAILGFKASALEWAGQYQQEPSPLTGEIIDPQDFKYYNPYHALPEFDLVVLSVDCAFKAAKHNDFVAIQKWGFIGRQAYLLEKDTRHLGYVQTKEAIKAMLARGVPASSILIEDRANGSAVIEEMKAEDFGASVISVEPEGSKESRAHAAATDIHAGDVFLAEGAPWLAEWKKICAAFPRVTHDDDIDSMTQVLAWKRKRSQGRLGVIEWIEGKWKGITEGAFRSDGTPKIAAVRSNGPAVTRGEGFKRWLETGKVPPCPACKNPSTAYMPDAKGSLQIFCRQCGRYDGKDLPQQKSPEDTCCGAKLQWVSGMLRCQNCGMQYAQGSPSNGMSRAQLAERNSQGAE